MESKKFTLGQVILSCIVTAIFFPALILLLAGNLLWLEGWIFSLWLVAMVVSNTIYLYVKDPALLAERNKAIGSENHKQWDKYLIPIIYLSMITWLVIMPLDAKRFAWSPQFPLWLKFIGGVALAPSLYLIYGSTVENTYLSTLVRIQTERKQHVISTGVYSFVRHPLYLGCVLMAFGAPLLLGSIYGLVIGVIALFLIVGRIIGEEKMLVNELAGYQGYRKKVKYRLIPYIW